VILLGCVILVYAQQARYSFEARSDLLYHVTMNFKGHLPIMGGLDGDAKVDLDIQASGKSNPDGYNVTADLESFNLSYNGDSAIPITLEDARKYFPATTYGVTPIGAVTGSDAKDIDEPLRLPGLDLAHIPRISFLPIRLPGPGDDGKSSYSYTEPSVGGLVTYSITPGLVTGDRESFQISYQESYVTLEDESETVVKKADAFRSVSTDDVGSGVANFSLSEHQFTKVQLHDVAVSRATEIDSHKISNRRLIRDVLITSEKVLPKPRHA